ncbi:MAG: alpha/beta fold hydrolase [Gemmatimonadaceae bacterium]|nr:alpha/beta fold hydrolase [Gemmatimonadaceae bacterium]
MSTFVLVHGAWLDATCWTPVAARLQAAGHTVRTPDLPGHGADSTPLAGQTLEAYTARVLREVDAAAEPVVLVGHSMGGIVISSVAEQRPERVQRLVYVAAYLLGAGETIRDQQDAASQVPPAMRPAADWSTIGIDPVLMPALFFHDVADTVAAPLIAGSRAEATAPFGTPLTVSDARWGRVPRSYVTTTLDRAVTPALQAQFLAARPCAPVIAMETGHAPFAAQPDTLAAHLLALAVL